MYAKIIVQIQQLKWPLIFSLAAHLVLLTLFSWEKPIHVSNPPRILSVRLVPLVMPQPAKLLLQNTPVTNTALPSKNKSQPQAILTRTTNEYSVNSDSRVALPVPLNMDALLGQVRDYTKHEFRDADFSPGIYGEYYGTYNGYDSGSFSVHLESSGRVYGSVQSDKLNAVSFIVVGNVAPNGLTEMTSSGIVDGAKFKGRLDIKTRKISGTWMWGVASGSFSGQHE